MTKKILITGKNSYIGKTFINFCSANNVDLCIEELNVHGEEWKLHDFSQYETVLHLAGIAHNSSNPRLEEMYYSINRDLTYEIAKKAKAANVSQFIFMSSMIVFGNHSNGKTYITKETIPKPDNFYGDSKLQAEKLLENLQSTTFNIAIIRPPMIYGKDSKGNYPLLSKIAQKTPFFPNYLNKRSMLYIENLCSIIYLIIKNKNKGKFHPQNSEYIQTSEMVKVIGDHYNHKIKLTRIFNLLIYFSLRIKIIQKVFGDLYYDEHMSEYEDGIYQIVNFCESIQRTEG